MRTNHDLTWREAVTLAMLETQNTFNTTGYDCPPPEPGRSEYVGTFRSFYDEIILTNPVGEWPGDQDESTRRAESIAAVEHADTYC